MLGILTDAQLEVKPRRAELDLEQVHMGMGQDLPLCSLWLRF